MPFLDVDAGPGQVTHARIQVGSLPDQTPISLPVTMIRGAKDGPTIYLQAGAHGDELTGIENCRTSLASIDPETLAGTVVGIPIVNVPSHLTRTRGFLVEERWLIDINRIYPGKPRGLITERIAHTIFNEFVMYADLIVDFHSALDGCDIAPHAGYNDDDSDGHLSLKSRLARAFGAPYIFAKPSSQSFVGSADPSGSLANRAAGAGRAMISAEMGESRRVSRDRVPVAVRGVHNVLRELEMEDGDPEPTGSQRVFSTYVPVHADHGGGLRMDADLGDEVRAGDRLGEIVDVFGETIETILAPADGFVFRVMRLGSISTGAEVVWIAQ